MTRRPTDQQFDTALMWLASNEGDNGEAEACRAVAEWLDLELNRRQMHAAVRRIARQAECSMTLARHELEKRSSK